MMMIIIFILKNLIETKQTSGNHCRKKTLVFNSEGSRANQATSYDIENTSLRKPSNIIQIQQQDTNIDISITFTTCRL